MKKILLRVMTLVLCVVVMGVAFPAFAAVESPIQPRWAALNSFQCGMSSQSGLFSNANAYSTASTKSAYDKLNLTLTIQVWSGGAYVDTDKSWSSSGTGATSVDKNINLGLGNYRAKSVVDVYSSSGAYIETVTRYSNDIVI